MCFTAHGMPGWSSELKAEHIAVGFWCKLLLTGRPRASHIFSALVLHLYKEEGILSASQGCFYGSD